MKQSPVLSTLKKRYKRILGRYRIAGITGEVDLGLDSHVPTPNPKQSTTWTVDHLHYILHMLTDPAATTNCQHWLCAVLVCRYHCILSFGHVCLISSTWIICPCFSFMWGLKNENLVFSASTKIHKLKYSPKSSFMAWLPWWIFLTIWILVVGKIWPGGQISLPTIL